MTGVRTSNRAICLTGVRLTKTFRPGSDNRGRRSGEQEAVLDAALQSAEAFYEISVINRKLQANKENRRVLENLKSMMERRVANRVSPNIELHEVTSRIDLLDISDRRLEPRRPISS